MRTSLVKITTKNERETRSLGKALGEKLGANDCLALWGDFGSGKTTFVKGLAAGLRVRRLRDVASPSFVILKIYQGRLPLYHFDFYRLGRTHDCLGVGIDEFLSAGGIAAIEWPQKVREALPERAWVLMFKVVGETERSISFKAPSARQNKILASLSKEFSG